MFVKIHKSYRSVIAICDEDILGENFEEGQMQIQVKESFFKGKKRTVGEVREIMEDGRIEDATFNIVGKESVNLALESKIITSEGVKTVQGTPIALILM